MAKYNEVMEHIEVTDEMQSRILSGVSAHFTKKNKIRSRTWISVMGMTAAAAVLVFVISPWNNSELTDSSNPTNPGNEGQTQVEGTFGFVEYSSREELAQAVGFDVPNIGELSDDVSDVVYSSIDNELAQIDFTYVGKTVSYRKSVGNEDNSGDYNEYEEVRDVQADNLTVTLSGSHDSIFLVRWTDSGYSYSISCLDGLDEEVMMTLVKDISKK